MKNTQSTSIVAEVSVRQNDYSRRADDMSKRRPSCRSAGKYAVDDRFALWPGRYHSCRGNRFSKYTGQQTRQAATERNNRPSSRNRPNGYLYGSSLSLPSSTVIPTKALPKRCSVASLDSGVADVCHARRSRKHDLPPSRRPLPRTTSAPAELFSNAKGLRLAKGRKSVKIRRRSATELKEQICEADEPDSLPAQSTQTPIQSAKERSKKPRINASFRKLLGCCCGNLLQNSRRGTEGLKSETIGDYHRIALPQLCARLHTDMDYGLTTAAVEVRLRSYGLNKLPPTPSLPIWLHYGRRLFDGYCIPLWIGAILCFIAYAVQASTNEVVPSDNLYLGVVLLGVVMTTGSFSYFQEVRSSKIMKSFARFMPWYSTVIRAGQELQINVEQLVPGDIVLLTTGERVPADCRIIRSINFKVDNSYITGEAEPQLRTPDCTSENPLESSNMIFSSTFSVEGSATTVVVATGDQTVMGRMARLTTGLKQKQMPIARELDLFVYTICLLAVALSILFLVWFLILNPDRWVDAVLLFIGIVMGVFPSGALIEVALCLTIAAKRIAKHNALVKNLEAVETLGSTSTICADKTGTLTMNQMTAAHLWFNNEIHLADVSKEQFIGEKYKTDGELNGWNSLIRIAALCSRAAFKPNQDDLEVMQRDCIGDGTESGLLKFAEQSIGCVTEFRRKSPKVTEIPFTSTTKCHVSVHRREDDGRFLVAMKGAPEKIIDMCSTIYLMGKDVPITEEIRESIDSVHNELAGLGERVVGFAELLLCPEKFPPNYRFTNGIEPNYPTSGLRFIGLIAMMDPPRPAVPDAVRKCRKAGIRVVMITGDHPMTAKSIARRVGIFTADSKTKEDIAIERSIPVSQVDAKEADAFVISGDQLRKMTGSELDTVITQYKELVFARTSPQQKLAVVEGFQRAGGVVAVTGDGVSDSPALKRADIGIAMGISGSDISKQCADMILMDDNFATIVFAIEDGRGNETEIAAPLAAVALNIPLPMSTIAMLVLSLLTDMVVAVMLAYEDAETDIMKRKPRNAKNDSLVNNRLISVSMGIFGVIEVCAGFFAYFVVLAESGFLPRDVWGVGTSFDNPGCNNLVDSYGQEWSFAQRKQLQSTLYSVYLLAVVQMQCIHTLACKASRCSLFEQNWRNFYLYIGLFIGIGIVVILCYCPGLNDALGLAPLLGRWWLIALPWCLLLVGVDQMRKCLIRLSVGPNSFGYREMLY